MINIEITFPDDFLAQLVTKEWLEKLITEKLKEVVVKEPEVEPEKPVDPKPIDPKPEPITPTPPPIDENKCKLGPEIKEVKFLTNKRLEVNFWGENIQEIKATLTKSGIVKQINTFKPTSDRPYVSLDSILTEGIYELTFEALNCTGKSTVSFEYKNQISGTILYKSK